MGEISELMLAGVLCEGCGTFLGIGDGLGPRRCIGCNPEVIPGRRSRGRSFAERQMRRHNRERHASARERKPFECQCGKLFADSNALLQHQKDKHPGMPQEKRPFVCSDCGSAFRLDVGLVQHRRDKHGI